MQRTSLKEEWTEMRENERKGKKESEVPGV
jgi:hypothetical protein